MLRVVERLQELKRDVEQRKTGCAIGAEQTRNSILMLGGEIGGGTNFNVVPERCWFTLDRASTRKKISMRRKIGSSRCSKNAGVMEFVWSGRFCRKAAPPLARKATVSAARSPRACKLSVAKHRDLRCVPVCWRLASTLR